MRVTLEEIYSGQTAVIMGALQLGDGKAYVRGFPVPLWTSYILLAAGILIPLLAWRLRRPSQQTKCHEHSQATDTMIPARATCRRRSGTTDENVGLKCGAHSSNVDDPANRTESPPFTCRPPRLPIEKEMMRVALAEIGWGHLFVFMGAWQIGADQAHMREFPIPLWTAYVLLAAGIALPLLAWYGRRPFKDADFYK